MVVDSYTFLHLGRGILGRQGRDSMSRDYREMFGVSLSVCVDLYDVCRCAVRGFKPKHLLWALMLMKTNALQSVLGALVQVTRKTFRKWAWMGINMMSDSVFEVIEWDNRYINDKGRTCLVSVDGVDFETHEKGANQGRFWRSRKGKLLTCNPKWYSHKFKGPGVRYEIGTCIQTGDIVWINGPFPCGSWPDKKILKHKLIHMLDENEMVETDRGHRGLPFHCRTSDDYLNEADKRAKAKVRARQETINRRFKQFGILSHKFRHDLSKHKVCFRAVALCVQLSFDNGERPFQVVC